MDLNLGGDNFGHPVVVYSPWLLQAEHADKDTQPGPTGRGDLTVIMEAIAVGYGAASSTYGKADLEYRPSHLGQRECREAR